MEIIIVSEFVPLPGALVVLRHGGEPLSVIQEIPSVRPPGGRRQRQSRAAPGGCAHTQHRHLEHLPLQTRCGPSEGGGPAPAVLRVLAPPLGSAPPVRQAVSAPRLPHGTERRARSGAPPSRSPRADGQTREARPGETLRVAGQRCPALASRKPPAPSSAPGRALGRVWETGFRPGKVKSVCANFWLPRCANFPVDGWKLFPVPFLKSGSFLGGKLEHT